MKNVITAIITLLMSVPLYAHKDVLVTKQYKNITVSIVTGYYYEDINKALIIGEYAQNLAEKLDFKDTLTIFFKHRYIKSSNKTKFSLERSVQKENSNYLIIYEKEDYDYFETLNILEALFEKLIKEGESDISFFENKEPSTLIKKVLGEKVYRPSFVDKLESNNKISYYVKDGKYYIYYLVMKEQENVFLTLESVYQISYLDNDSFIIFNDKNSFYYAKTDRLNKLQKKSIDAADFFSPYRVFNYSQDSIAIEMSRDGKKNKTIIFNYVKNTID